MFYICQKQILMRKEPCEQAKCLFRNEGRLLICRPDSPWFKECDSNCLGRQMKAAAELSLWMKTGRMDWAAQREERLDNKQLCKHSATTMIEAGLNRRTISLASFDMFPWLPLKSKQNFKFEGVTWEENMWIALQLQHSSVYFLLSQGSSSKAGWFLCFVSIARCFMSCELQEGFCCLLRLLQHPMAPFIRSAYLFALKLLAVILGFFFLNLLSFTRQLLVPGYQEIWYTADGARKSSSPASNVRLWKWDLLTLLDDPAPPASMHSCTLIVFPLPATLSLPRGGLGRGRFQRCCEHLLRTQVQKMPRNCSYRWKVYSFSAQKRYKSSNFTSLSLFQMIGSGPTRLM